MAALLVGALSLPAFAQDKPRQGGELIFIGCGSIILTPQMFLSLLMERYKTTK